jgi:hypothetical protein
LKRLVVSPLFQREDESQPFDALVRLGIPIPLKHKWTLMLFHFDIDTQPRVC